jgi:mannose-6-phosphate isomerase-like protein (cupin superfamily)
MQRWILGTLTLLVCAAAVGGGIVLGSQIAAKPLADLHSSRALEDKGKSMLLEAAKSSSGSVSSVFETYPGHFTQLTARTRSGGGEQHRQLTDVFFVVDGDATEIVGGRMVDATESQPGEVRGTRVEGGESYPLHKGDVLHIPANIPHQTIVPAGRTFVYFVVKVGDQPARMVPASR